MWLNLYPVGPQSIPTGTGLQSGTVPRDVILSNTYYTSDVAKKDNKQVKHLKNKAKTQRAIKRAFPSYSKISLKKEFAGIKSSQLLPKRISLLTWINDCCIFPILFSKGAFVIVTPFLLTTIQGIRKEDYRLLDWIKRKGITSNVLDFHLQLY